jgi:hypothetical protein
VNEIIVGDLQVIYSLLSILAFIIGIVIFHYHFLGVDLNQLVLQVQSFDLVQVFDELGNLLSLVFFQDDKVRYLEEVEVSLIGRDFAFDGLHELDKSIPFEPNRSVLSF